MRSPFACVMASSEFGASEAAAMWDVCAAAALAEFMKADKIFVSRGRPECAANAYLLTSRLDAGMASPLHNANKRRFENKQIPES